MKISVTSFDKGFYQELEQVIQKNLSDPKFNVEQLRKNLYLSRVMLYWKIMALSGEPPCQFSRSYRRKLAAQLLKANFGNVTEVALAVEFTNMAYFSQCFKTNFVNYPIHINPQNPDSKPSSLRIKKR